MKKCLVFFLFFAAKMLVGQDCASISSSFDEYTGKMIGGFDSPFVLDNNGLYSCNANALYFEGEGKARLSFISKSIGCTDYGSSATLKFADGTTLKLLNSSDTDCSGHIFIHLKSKQAKIMSEKKVTSITFKDYAEIKHIFLKPNVADEFLELMKCFYEKAFSD